MKTMVVYQSSTGFTKQYAEWIAADCGCEARDIKKVSADEVSQSDRVIFGGWIMGNMIMGLDKIKKMNPRQLIVFAVGGSPAIDDIVNTIREVNHLEDSPFYYFEGGFHFEQLNLPTKMMLKALKKSIEKKADQTEQDKYMARSLGTSYDHADRKYIEPLLENIREA
ncbi:MAG: hypothetical protein GX567_11715 [Clostridia bacterium]|nr:hypothetical protein [Clostridia bacterium]